MAWLSDPFWQFVITSVLAFAAIPTSFLILRLQKSYKKLSYETVAIEHLLTVDNVIRESIEVVFKGRKIQDLTLVLVKVYNSGNTPIDDQDYKQPVHISFGENAEVIGAGISSTSPATLGVAVAVSPNRVDLSPVLLNAGDAVTVWALVSQFRGNVQVDARIVGVQRIEKAKIKSGPKYIPLQVIGLILVIYLSSSFALLLQSISPGFVSLMQRIFTATLWLYNIYGFVQIFFSWIRKR